MLNCILTLGKDFNVPQQSASGRSPMPKCCFCDVTALGIFRDCSPMHPECSVFSPEIYNLGRNYFLILPFVFDGVSVLVSRHHLPLVTSKTQLVFLDSFRCVYLVQLLYNQRKAFVLFGLWEISSDVSISLLKCHPNHFRISQGSRHVMSPVKAILCSHWVS